MSDEADPLFIPDHSKVPRDRETSERFLFSTGQPGHDQNFGQSVKNRFLFLRRVTGHTQDFGQSNFLSETGLDNDDCPECQNWTTWTKF